MKKITIVGIALGLTLLCLVRFDLAAKEPAEKGLAKSPSQTQPAAGISLGSQAEKPKTAPASVDALRYMPNGSQGIFWVDVAELRKINPSWWKTICSDYGLRAEDIDRITVGLPVWPIGNNSDSAPVSDVSVVAQSVATIVLAQPVAALEAKEQIEKSLGSCPWRDEKVHGVTLHVQQSKKPIAFFLPAKQTLVIGSAKLVREVLLRGTPLQLSGKLAATWARLDRSHAFGLMIAPPAAGEPARAFLPDDLCDGIEPVVLEADTVAGKAIRFRLSAPCVDAGVAYQVRGLCETFVKATAAGLPQLADAAKSFQFAVNDRCFVLQGRLPTSIFQDGLKPARPTAGFHTLRSFLPDDLCDGIKGAEVEADMVPGKDLRFRLSVPCVDSGIACEVRGLCETFCKAMGAQFAGQTPSATEVMKAFQFAVNDRCFVMQGRLPASLFEGDYKTTMRRLMPDDVCNGIEKVVVKVDMDAGRDVHFRLSIPCVDVGIAYQVRGLCAILINPFNDPKDQNSKWAAAVKSFECKVNDRCFVFQGKLPASLFQETFKEATSWSEGPQPAQKTPHQEVLCELSQTYLKGFQQGLTDPANQEEAGRRLLEKARERGGEFPRDAKLNETQRMFRDLSEVGEQGFLQAAQWQDLDPKQKGDEARWLKQLSSDNESSRMLAIYALTAMKSKKAVPGILKIAYAERKEKENADRALACRALGVIGDSNLVPELVHLSYHYNRDTRLWAQISLVRLTGENFGRDVAAWRQWWQKQGGKPPISEKVVVWATSPETLRLADPKDMEAADRQLLDMAKKLSTLGGKTGQSSVPGRVSR